MKNLLLSVCFNLQKVIYPFRMVFLWWLVPCFIMAQQPSFRAITTDSDLPSNEVYSILQDQQGFIWIGCDAGLFRYNGIKFILYKTPKQKSKSITGLVEAPDGRIYCHNFTGQVFYIEANQMFELDCFNATYISNITTNQENELWIVTQEGLAYYSPKTKTCRNYDEKTKGVSRNFTDTNGDIWATASNFIGKVDSNKKLTIYPARKDATDEFDHFIICGGGDEKILITITTGNIYKLFGNTLAKYDLLPLKKALEGKKVTNVFTDQQGRLWVATYTGVIVYDFKTTQARIFLEQFSFSDILQDTNGSMWLTTLYDGILYIPTMTFENWQTIEKILKICHDNHKKVYFGNSSGTLGELDVESKQLKTYNVGTKSDIRSLNYDKADQSVYFNVNSSLYSLKNEQISIARSGSHSVKNLIHTPEGYLVASSAKTYFVKKLDTEESQTVNEQWGRSLVYDAQHQKVWVATNKGLLKLVYQNNEYVIQDKLLQDQQVLDISLWEEKNFVFAVTFEGFVYQINQESIEPIAQLPENVQAYNILFHQEKLFIGTNRGLWVYDLKSQKWQKISTLEGLISDNVLSFTILKDKIWLGTAKGVQSLPLNYNLKKELPKIYLRKFLLNNQEHKNLQNVQTQASDSLKIYIEAVSYHSGDKFQYAYRLNKSSVWSYLPASTEAISLNALPVGKFLLEIKVVDHLGRDSGNKIVLEGEVLPHIWQRGWFVGVVVLVLGGLIWLLFRFRIHRLQQKQEQALRQISLENELKLWQQTALQVQMNPHFLFNILNSIKAYIYENDKQKAIRYLNHFANLVRKILHNSNQKLITLSEELEVISHYIELEAMLLEENFTWKIDIPENIPTTDVYIPTLLIQPFVENAFKHGLRHKKGMKELWISVVAENEKELKIVIEDNGIGRKQAAEINRKQKPLHQSFATQNIEQRMKLINQNHDFELLIETIDKENVDSEPLGTKIILTVRYKDETITQA